MGVPKRKTSKMRLRTRKAANAWKAPGLYVDPKTGNRHHGHTVDPETGMYRGRQIITKTTGE
jgi:large subunit ribosomal protein L32